MRRHHAVERLRQQAVSMPAIHVIGDYHMLMLSLQPLWFITEDERFTIMMMVTDEPRAPHMLRHCHRRHHYAPHHCEHVIIVTRGGAVLPSRRSVAGITFTTSVVRHDLANISRCYYVVNVGHCVIRRRTHEEHIVNISNTFIAMVRHVTWLPLFGHYTLSRRATSVIMPVIWRLLRRHTMVTWHGVITRLRYWRYVT